MRLTLAFWSAKPNWMPRKPKHMFQICQNDSAGRRAGVDSLEGSAVVVAACMMMIMYSRR
jgi:hypothetical protein